MSYSDYLHYSLDPTGKTRFYGIYRGLVANNYDPESKNRLSVVIPQVTGSDRLDLVPACFPPILASSPVVLPEIATEVWVMFESGDPNYPVWIGVKP